MFTDKGARQFNSIFVGEAVNLTIFKITCTQYTWLNQATKEEREGGGWGEGAGKVFLPETFDKNQKLLILKKNSPICFKVLIRLYSKLSFKSLLNFNQKVFT